MCVKEDAVSCAESVLQIQKLLFVCSQNRWRSLTAERMYDGYGGYKVKSAGTEQGARIRVNEGHIGWADLMFVMEKNHAQLLQSKFQEALIGKKLICLHIPDDYRYMEPDLIELLKANLSGYVDVPE
jgi:predicted protein tyrosine phosphatase